MESLSFFGINEMIAVSASLEKEPLLTEKCIMSSSSGPNCAQKVRKTSGGIPSSLGDFPVLIFSNASLSSVSVIGESRESAEG